MVRPRPSLLVIASFLLPVFRAAAAWDEPSGFRGIPWGASMEVVQEKSPGLYCIDSARRNRSDAGTCAGQLAIGPTTPKVVVRFRSGGMDAVFLSFPTRDFATLRPIFVERYGEPTSTRTEELQNRMGAKFENEILEWSGEKVYILLQRYGSEITDGLATIRTRAGFDEEVSQRMKKLKEGKKDL
jgi:hypothetical protein